MPLPRGFWRAIVQINRVFGLFQSGFLGKVSPVHFFWSSFDLAVSRFSGRPAPLHPGGVSGLSNGVMQEAYSHEVSSARFWPGSDRFPQAAFYSYAYPEPSGFRTSPVPKKASFEQSLGEFVLPYSAVRDAADPDALLLAFLSSTYIAAAKKSGIQFPWGSTAGRLVSGAAPTDQIGTLDGGQGVVEAAISAGE